MNAVSPDDIDFAPLVARLAGDLHADPLYRAMLATDGSIFSVTPAAVVYPRNAADVQHTVRFAAAHRLAVHSRGAGSGLCGGALGRGIVLDFTRHMNRLLRLDLEARTFECEPGYRCGELQARLANTGLFFPPDPSSGEYATFGGMTGTNASGSHSVKYGNVADYLEDAEIVLGSGEKWRLSTIQATPRPELPEALQALAALYEDNAESIEKAYPDTPYNSAGYNLRQLVRDGRLDLRRLLAGAEGTLAVATRLKFRLRERPAHDSLVVAYMDDVVASAEAVLKILPMGPSGIEVMDKSLLNVARDNDPALARTLPDDLDHVLLIEFDGMDPGACADQARQVRELLQRGGFTDRAYLAVDAEEKNQFWSVRKAAVPILYKLKGRRKILALVEDAAVPIENLVEFYRGIYRVLGAHGVDFVIVGHIAKGLLHTRPLLDLKDANDVRRLKRIADDYYEMVQALGGTVSGEHGDGRLRSAYIKRRYPAIYDLFLKTKNLLDPQNLLNPEVITHHDPDQMMKALRYGTGYRTIEPLPTRLQWPENFDREIEQCHGCSKCTTVTTATRMCPVFKFTRSEAAAPKAKANVLRALISGRLEADALYTRAFQEVMDHCINCGSCHLECPSNVNIPKMALEARARYARRFGVSLGDRAAGHIERVARGSHRLAPVLRPLQSLPLARQALEATLGVDARRPPPAFAARSLFERLPAVNGRGARRVVYFAGCYAGYIRPEIGAAAVRLLNHLGFQVLLPEQHCCGLPLLSKGMADAARDKIRTNLAHWRSLMDAAEAVVVTCSSCGHALREEWGYLAPAAQTDAVSRHTTHISQLVNDCGQSLRLGDHPLRLAYHHPCHLKLQADPDCSVHMLARLPGVAVMPLKTHCCGMAGSWGLKAANYDLSREIGADLIRRLDQADADYGVTDCPTCRMQMEDFSRMPIRHPVEIVADRLRR
ncbi:MAG: anaerobic glycerol-3-phosphate dehydrogenase subunit C [Desulfobacterales bacterium]|nr:anaerobic glycerol-3-phosphate dehydrogenase subunit C [Desulfobacterales bacterium]